jgi:hypothetical protein
VDYWHLLVDLPAIIGASSMLALLSPWRMQPRAVPALLFIVAMIVLVLPTLPVVALALMLPAALLQRYLGIDLHGHEAADYSPAVEKARDATRAARQRARRPKPVAVTQFVTHAFPAPEDAAELAHADADVEDDPADTPATPSTEPEPSPAEQMRERLDQLVSDPRLPAGAAARLAGQRGGRDTSVGLRNGTTRSFVPAL